MIEKYKEKLFHHAKNSATNANKTVSKTAIQKTAESTGDLIGNKTANNFTKLSKSSPQIKSENEKEIPKERYIYPQKKDSKLLINEDDHNIKNGISKRSKSAGQYIKSTI